LNRLPEAAGAWEADSAAVLAWEVAGSAAAEPVQVAALVVALGRVEEISAEEAWGAALAVAALAPEEASEAVVLAASREAALVDRDSVAWEA